MADPHPRLVRLSAVIQVAHDWVARDGRGWAFRLVEAENLCPPPCRHAAKVRVAFLVNEDDLP